MKGLSAQVQLKEEWDRVSLTVEDRWRVKKVGYGTFLASFRGKWGAESPINSVRTMDWVKDMVAADASFI